MIPRFCIQHRITDREVHPCSLMHLKTVMQSNEIQSVCDQIKLQDGQDKEEIQKLKRQLPIITPHAQSFQSSERKNQNAVPSGLVMLDIDDVEDVHALASRVDDSLLRDHHVYLVAITPSGHGLRVIGERASQESIATGQARLAQLYGVSSYDSSTKDLARASYVMPWSYVLYIDESGLEFADEETASRVGEAFAHVEESSLSPSVAELSTLVEEQLPHDYKGTPYSDIISQLVGLLGGEPEVGERNTFYFTLVRYARYICDFNKGMLLGLLPSFGLSEQERTSIIMSAVNRPRKSEVPDLIRRAMALAASAGDSPVKVNEQSIPLPAMPRLLEVICKHVPESFRPSMVIASLPILGTLATRIRFRYLDHQEHSFSFMSCITAPCATGKSFIREPINLLLTPIDEQDAVERQKEEEYKEALRAAKNSKNQPENPRACPRNNGINVSIAKLLQLLSFSEGKHLIGIGEEIDTLVKSERAGVWSQKSDIYRLGFDNAKYGQNYMSDNSFSANVPVYYNLLLTGTPGGMYRFFKDVEDGLVTRFCFAQLPDMFGSEMPVFTPYTSSERDDVIRMSRRLYESEGTLHCSMVDEAIRVWLEDKRQQAIASDSRAIDTFRRRSAVIGFRAGYLAYLLYKHEPQKRNRNIGALASEFATYVAEYVFVNQMQLFGAQFEQVSDSYLSSQSHRGKVRQLLQSLPETFTKSDLMALRVRNGQTTDVAYVLTRWRQNGLIEDVGSNTYRKLQNCRFA